MTSRIHQGEALAVLRTLPAESVHCVVTSPPYWGLRDYGVAGQLGLEECVDCGWHGTPAPYRSILATQGVGPCGACFVCHMVAVFSEVRRVLRADGTLWLNMGDGYAGSWGAQGRQGKSGILAGRNACAARQIAAAAKRSTGTGRMDRTGLKPKDMIGQPWRLALALQATGWWLRSEIIWHKPTCMPESIQDRPTKAHETIFLLAKAQAYYYDATAIREPAVYANSGRESKVRGDFAGKGCAMPGREPFRSIVEYRNARSVWTIPTGRFPGAHFATFPEDLPAICIKAGTSEFGACPACGTPWARDVKVRRTPDRPGRVQGRAGDTLAQAHGPDGRAGNRNRTITLTTQWIPGCSCEAGEPVQAVVLDPFAGAGTTGLVARQLGRQFVGIELSPKYCRMAAARIERETGLFGPVEIVRHHPGDEARFSAAAGGME